MESHRVSHRVCRESRAVALESRSIIWKEDLPEEAM